MPAKTGNHIRGFTLVELMVVVSIMGIMMAIAIPNMRDMMVDQRVRTAASDLVAELAYARTEAMRYNRHVIIEPIVAGVWKSGWNIYIDNDTSGGFNAGDVILKINNDTLPSTLKTCSNVGEFTSRIIFTPNGTIMRTSATTNLDRLTISDNTTSSPKVRQIYFGPTGRASVVGDNGGTACP